MNKLKHRVTHHYLINSLEKLVAQRSQVITSRDVTIFEYETVFEVVDDLLLDDFDHAFH